MRNFTSILIVSRLVVLLGGLALLAGGCGGGEPVDTPDQVKQRMADDENRSNAMENASKAPKAKAH
jgi:hypothetical protein